MFEDLGSGCVTDLSASGVAEPLARESGRAGVALISFSGDKLLGGPQAGIIAGKQKIVERIRRNPLFRALRVDKLTIAALETTLKAYHRGRARRNSGDPHDSLERERNRPARRRFRRHPARGARPPTPKFRCARDFP